MTHILIKTEPSGLSIDLSGLVPHAQMTTAQFYDFCLANPDLRIERTATGDVIVMPPAFADTGNRNLRIAQQLANWVDQDGTGVAFDSSAGFTLPNGATRSPDAAWIRLDRWKALSDDEQASFAPICPDFVVELRSATDTVKSLKEKLQEYMENGSQLGLLIDRKSRTVYVYRLGREPEMIREPDSISCDPELPGFVLQMAKIW